MNIKKVSLLSGGFKGAEIVFLKADFKNNRPVIHTITEERKNPIHMDFERIFKDLRIHLLEIFKIANNRLSESEIKTLILDTDVHSIEWDGDGFIIKGDIEAFAEKRFKLPAGKVQESDEYEGYNEVRGLIEALKIEAVSYMDGLKVVSDREMMLRWLEARKDSNMTKEAFELLSEEEQKTYMNKTLNSKFGAEIEIDVDSEDETEEEEMESVVVIDDESDVVEIPVKKGKEPKSPGTVKESF